MQKYEPPTLCKNENLKELTKFGSVISPIDGWDGYPSWWR